MKRNIFKIGIILLGLFFTTTASSQESKGKIRTLALDAGHGGEDPGAIGRKGKEKDIVLDVVLRVGALIEQKYPEINVIYTRKKDVFVKLIDRAQVANTNHVDLFISVHCNATKNFEVSGAETFVMGLSKTEANLETAKKENASILLEANHTENYNGFDPNNDEDYIALTMFQSASLDQSLHLAQKVQNELTGKTCDRHDRGVKQAGFLVLYRVSVPSILVELGFISNAAEENYLLSEAGKNNYANALLSAFSAYKTEYEANYSYLEMPEKQTDPTVEATNEKPVYYIQIAASPKKMDIKKSFKNVNNVTEKKVGGNYVYLTEKSSSVESTQKTLSSIKSKGYKDAFVVAFIGEKRITVKEAQAMK